MEYLRFLMMFVRDDVLYLTGLLVILPFFPFCRVESIWTHRSNPYMWKSRGFTYQKSGKRYFYYEAVQAIGAAVWIVLLLAFVANMHE